MDNVINILLTGGGAPGVAGTIYSLKNNPDKKKFKIFLSDIKQNCIGQYLSNRFFQVPPPEDENYIGFLINKCISEKIKVIVPQTTREIVTLSKNKNVFRKRNITVVVSDYNSILKANDKYLILKESEHNKLPTPKYCLIKNQKELDSSLKLFEYPKKKVVVRPRLSNGSRGLRILTEETLTISRYLNEKPSGLEVNLESFKKYFYRQEFPEILITEYLPGLEYTVDVFRNKSSIFAIPRTREEIRSGITFKTKIDLREDLISYSKKLASSLNLVYCFGFQFKLDSENNAKILESNPRVQGTMVASTFAGLNMIYYSILDSLGEKYNLSNIRIRDVEFSRYWGGIGVYTNKILGKI